MENSSESNWHRSSSSSRNPRRIPANTVRFSGETDHDSVSGIIGSRRREKGVLGQLGQTGRVGYFREGDGAVIRPVEAKDVSLRQWLDNTERVVSALDCLHIFMQIVEIVNLAHSQGFVVQNVRPSCFVMSSFNRVSFIESVSCSDSDSCEEDESNSNHQTTEKNSWLNSGNFEQIEGKKDRFPMKKILQMEANWYTSPEEAAAGGGSSSCASDVYRLGVLLFELYCTSSSAEEKNATMSNLRHRVFPPQLLLKWPKEALFCLWLLHPEPASRPKIDEVMQSEFLNEPRDNLVEREAAIELKEKIEEQELLLEFLLMLQQRKQESADNLHRTISFLSSDLQEITKLQTLIREKQVSNPNPNLGDDDSASSGSRKRNRNAEISDNNLQNSNFKSSRLMKNFKKLESAYFSTRRKAFKPLTTTQTLKNAKNTPISSEKSSANNFPPKNRFSESKKNGNGWINSFLEGLSKYLSFKDLKVKTDLKQGDLLNSSNLVCSLGFDRDGEFFATAGVNKKIKVFEYDSILNEDRDIHYPVVEMSSRSKLSSICWNNYIKGQIASSNFEGVVQIWDVTRNQIHMELKEHERRVWSVDFSTTNPTLLASGSDDGSIKLWNINQAIISSAFKSH